jgi:hypothetical protein
VVAAVADKPFLDVADQIIDALPWNLGTTPKQRKAARGVVSALTHHVQQLLANGWTPADVRAALDEVTADVAPLPTAAAQQTRWRAALKRAKHDRQRAAELATAGPAGAPDA